MRFLNAIGFLTIIKIPEKSYLKREEFPGMLVYFPVAGFLIGLMCAAVFAIFNFFLPLILAVILAVAFETILTGGIHIDGLADTFDGIFSGERDRDKIMEIMKKGDVGVFGVLSIFFLLAIKIALLYILCRALGLGGSYGIFLTGFPLTVKSFLADINLAIPGFLVFLTAFVFAPVFGRLSMVGLFASHNPLKSKEKTQMPQSLAGAFFDKSNHEVFLLSAAYLSILFVAVSIFAQLTFMEPSGGWLSSSGLSPGITILIIALKSFIVAVLTLLFARIMGRFFTARTGGLSGDVIGAVCVVTELFFLFLFYLSIIFL